MVYKEDSNDMLSPRATGRDAGVGCCGLACLQISWDGKPTIGKIARQNMIREWCCDSISLSNNILVFLCRMIVSMRVLGRPARVCVHGG